MDCMDTMDCMDFMDGTNLRNRTTNPKQKKFG